MIGSGENEPLGLLEPFGDKKQEPVEAEGTGAVEPSKTDPSTPSEASEEVEMQVKQFEVEMWLRLSRPDQV